MNIFNRKLHARIAALEASIERAQRPLQEWARGERSPISAVLLVTTALAASQVRTTLADEEKV